MISGSSGFNIPNTEYICVTSNDSCHVISAEDFANGEVIDIVDYGAFVRIGPMDGLIHVSQVTDDYINFDAKRGALLAKESNKSLDDFSLDNTNTCFLFALSNNS